jgi:hypothetical protein
MQASMRTIILFLLVAPAWGQLAVSVPTGSNALPVVTNAQFALAETGYSGTCTIVVSTDPSFTSPATIPDLNGVEYSGAATDTGRTDTITQSTGPTRLVTIGHDNDDRALQADTTYYWKVSGCGTTVTGSQRTTTLAQGTATQWPVPFNSSSPWNWGYPQANLLSPTPMVDPTTGVGMTLVNTAADWGWRTGANQVSGPYSNCPGTGPTSSWSCPLFSYWTGGTGWTNPANILNGSTSTASTSNTNTLDVYTPGCCTDPADPWSGIALDDLGIVPFATASNQTGTNNQFTLCIFTSPVAGCLGTPITVAATNSGAIAQVLSGDTNDLDQPFPASFPGPFFSGWGLTAPLGPDHVNTQGTLSCASGVCTVDTLARYENFPNTMVVGQKIYIAGSSPTCTNNICTLATYGDQSKVTLSENLTISTGTQFYVLMWGVRIAKVTATGTLTVGLAFKQAGGRGLENNSAGAWNCSSVSFVSGDGHTGFLCTYIPTINVGAIVMYFVSGDGTVRRVWTGRTPSSSSCYSPAGANNIPGGVEFNVGGVVFSPTNGKVFFAGLTNAGGSLSIYQITYTGDASTNIVPASYQFSSDGNTGLQFSPCDLTTWVNLLPPTTGNDLNSQIAAYSTAYNSTLYGLTFTLAGISGTTAFFSNNYSGQNNPAWIAVVDLSVSPALLKNMIHTLDGTGTTSATTTIGPAAIRWGGHHNLTAILPNNTGEFTEDLLAANNTSVLLGGPFEAAPIGLLEADGVTWNSNTSLAWPPNSSAYYTICPGGNPYASWSYATTSGGSSVTNNCVTFQFPQGGVCNIAPSTTELANFTACPWHSGYSQPVALAVGDNFTDVALGGGITDTGDSEHFRIVSISTLSSGCVGGGTCLKIVAMRNAVFDYCGISPAYFPGSTVNNALGSGLADGTHANGWTAIMNPARLNGCNTGTYYYTYASGGSTIVEEGRGTAGHGTLIPGATPGNVTKIGPNGITGQSEAVIINQPISTIFALPTVPLGLLGPTFQGNTLGIGAGAVQSYPASPGGVPWMTDSNSLNGNLGLGAERPDNTIGSVTLTAEPSVCATCWIISVLTNDGFALNNTNYKIFPLPGWAGRYLLHDMSGPSSNIATSLWGICYVYAAGECTSGSTAGTVHVNVPGAYNSGSCNTGQSWLLAPCVIFGFPGGGAFRTQLITGADTTGVGSQQLGYALAHYGMQYPYAEGNPLADGSAVIYSGHQGQNWGTQAFLSKMPSYATSGTQMQDFVSSGQTVPSGHNFAWIEWGYSRYIGANAAPGSTFYCTQRLDKCDTGVTGSDPYSFGVDNSPGTACSGGCSLTIPVSGPNLVYYQIFTSATSTGSRTALGDIQVLGVSGPVVLVNVSVGGGVAGVGTVAGGASVGR